MTGTVFSVSLHKYACTSPPSDAEHLFLPNGINSLTAATCPLMPGTLSRCQDAPFSKQATAPCPAPRGFPLSPEKSSGIPGKPYDSLEMNQYRNYFVGESEYLRSEDGIKFVVCNQWGIFNIGSILQFANSQGYNVVEYK